MKPFRLAMTLIFVVSASLFAATPPSEAAIQQAVSDLNAYAALQKKASLQNSSMAYAERKAFVMADLLIGSDGVLNLSIIDLLKTYFLPSPQQEYESNISDFLSQFDETWQPFFDSITQPPANLDRSNLILRAMFELGPDSALTDRDAKVAVLAAMFSPLQQGPVGNCFAVGPLIREHYQWFLHVAKDHVSILKNQYIMRMIGTTPAYFFFCNTLADSDPEKTVTIDATGLLTSSKVSIFATPGLQRAFTVMGAKLVANFNANLLNALYKGTPSGTLKVSIANIINAAANVIATNLPNTQASDLAIQGRYAFSSLTTNALLKATEGAFAAMAEERPNDSIRRKVNNIVKSTLTSAWSAIGTSATATSFKTAFETNLNNSFRFLYDLSIAIAPGSLVGKTRAGGFILYKKTPGQPTVLGTHIVTPQDFRQFILEVINRTATQLGATSSVQTIATQLTQVVLTDTFLTNVLVNYDPANSSISNPIVNYKLLAQTPMQNCNGASSNTVALIDIGTPNTIVKIVPPNTQTLLNWCLGIAKLVTLEFVPMTAPNHAFNFAATNPDLAAFVRSGQTSDVWIRNALVIPGMRVATSAIDATTKTTLANAAYKSLGNLVSSTAYNNLIANLSANTMTLQGFSQGIVDGVVALAGAGAQSQIENAVDTAIFNTLTSLNRAMLQNSAIRFAFMNWHNGSLNKYFCAYFNPRSQKIALGQINEDKTNLSRMDEVKWVINQQWDVVVNPATPPANAA